jgi:hypothetical protein
MKTQVMAVFDSPRLLARDEMMLSTEHEVRVNLSDDEVYITYPDVQTLKRTDGLLNTTNKDMEQMVECNKTLTNLNLHPMKIKSMLDNPSQTTSILLSHDVTNNDPQQTREVPKPDSRPVAYKAPNETADHRVSIEPNATSNLVHQGIGSQIQKHCINEEDNQVDLSKALQFAIPDDSPQDFHEPLTPSTDTNGCNTDGSVSSGTCSSPENLPSHNSGKEVIVKRILNWFKTWLDLRLTLLAYQCDGGDQSPSFSKNSASPSQGGDRPEQSQWGEKRCRERDDPNKSDDERDDEGDGKGGGREIKRVKTEAKESRDFACPFYKHNRRKYQTWRCCAWSGWKSVHRVK